MSRNVSLCTDYMKLIIAALVIVISFIFLKFSNGMFYMAKSIKHFHRVEERTWKYCCRWSASSTNVRIEDRKDKVKNENRFSDSWIFFYYAYLFKCPYGSCNFFIYFLIVRPLKRILNIWRWSRCTLKMIPKNRLKSEMKLRVSINVKRSSASNLDTYIMYIFTGNN